MPQIQFRRGLRPRSRWGAHSDASDPVAGFRGRKQKGKRVAKRNEENLALFETHGTVLHTDGYTNDPDRPIHAWNNVIRCQK